MFSERLKCLRKEKKISQFALSQDLKLGRSTITQYETGSRTPDYQTLLKIAQYFSVSVDYLLGNSQIIQGDDQIRLANDQKIDKGALYVAGTDAQYKNLKESTTPAQELFFFPVLDDSMKNARMITGDWAVIRKQKHFDNGDIILIAINNESPVIRKAFHQDNGLILQTENPQYPAVLVNASEIEIMGKVIEVRFQV